MNIDFKLNNYIHEINADKTQEDLMKHFKTVSKIKVASEKELVDVVGLAKAKILINYFEKNIQN